MAFPLQRSTAPASEPITLAAMKNYLRVDYPDDDALIQAMISAAREDAEDFTGRSFVSQQWIYAMDYWPVFRYWESAPSRSDYDALGNFLYNGYRYNHSQTINIPRPPLISMDAVVYTDMDGVQQTIASTEYQLDLLSCPARIMPAYGSYWPMAQPIANAVQLTFTAGYSNPALPFGIVQAIQLTVAAWYRHREDFSGTKMSTLPMGATRLLNMHRVEQFGYSGR